MKTTGIFFLLVFGIYLAVNCQDMAEGACSQMLMNDLYQMDFSQKIIGNTKVRFDNDTLYYAFLFARMHYRGLDDVIIHLKYKKMRKSTMRSQPQVNVFTNKSNRVYRILINEDPTLNGIFYRDFSINSIIGWFGHEIGHIVDYFERSDLGLMVFGLNYVFSDRFMRTAEVFADSTAVFHGLGYHLLEGAEFCLNSDKISPAYKQKLKDYYLLPDDIRKLIYRFESKIVLEADGRDVSARNRIVP